ncbi:acetylserotonin O-methyltransferase [Kitasatospora sp. NBC_01250]|uniref:methyltransferase n=1 Tax=Kitasatospora sp. NBC_01250 TaxID=2903571 RepID=UPI002E30C46F|nr:methyltransferase [Kitasatospora sp. NBC_01250]
MSQTPPGGAATAFAPLIFQLLAFQVHTTAVRLGVPDAIGDTPRSTAELATVLGADEANLHRLLRALVAFGLLRYTEDGQRFALTETGAELREDAPGEARGLVAFFGEPLVWQAFGALEESIRTGGPAFTKVTDAGFFEYFAKDPDFAQSYHHGLPWGTAMLAPLLQMAYDWSASRRIVDVGGGTGTLLGSLLAAHPQAHGVVFDSPEALEQLPATAERLGVADRCTGESGDFLATAPAGGDIYLLKNVLHEWGDADCVRILGNCRQAMAADGKVLIVATLLPEPGPVDDPSAFQYAALSDIELMTLSHGERTLAEYTSLCAGAGLRITNVLKVPYLPNDNIIEAVAA